METILKEYEFLLTLVKSRDTEKLLKDATPSQVEAFLACLSLRKDISPLVNPEKAIITRGLRTKKLGLYYKRYKKIVDPILACALLRMLQEALTYICDYG